MQSGLAAQAAKQLGIKNLANRLERFSFMLDAQEGELLKTNNVVFIPKELTQLFK